MFVFRILPSFLPFAWPCIGSILSPFPISLILYLCLKSTFSYVLLDYKYNTSFVLDMHYA